MRMGECASIVEQDYGSAGHLKLAPERRAIHERYVIGGDMAYVWGVAVKDDLRRQSPLMGDGFARGDMPVV